MCEMWGRNHPAQDPPEGNMVSLKSTWSLCTPAPIPSPQGLFSRLTKQRRPLSANIGRACAAEEVAIVRHGSRTGHSEVTRMKIWVNVRKTNRSLRVVQKISPGCSLRRKNWGLVINEPQVCIRSSYLCSLHPTSTPPLPCGPPAASPPVGKMNEQSPQLHPKDVSDSEGHFDVVLKINHYLT